MTDTFYEKLKIWFKKYVSEFPQKDPKHKLAYEVKIEHSLQVSNEMEVLALHLGHDSTFITVAKTIGLLHDIGRFEQFESYQTFRDVDSVDHAALACEVINRNQLLDSLSNTESDQIHYAIAHHNKKEIPATESIEKDRYLKMIRDADKLDIWRVVCHHYQSEDGHEAIGLDLPDLPEISANVAKMVCDGELVHMHELKTLNDFKLLQMGWVYDLNFPWSHQAAYDRGYLQTIVETLPESFLVDQVLQATLHHLQKQASLKG